MRLSTPTLGLQQQNTTVSAIVTEKLRRSGVRDVEHLVAQSAVRANRVDLRVVAVGQRAAVANLHVLRAARLGSRRREVRQVRRRGAGSVTSTIDKPFLSIDPVAGFSASPA